MFDQITRFLIETLFGLFIYIVLMRLWMQVLRAPFRNPVGQFVMALTDWAIIPLRRVIPPFGHYDLATFIVAWLAQILKRIVLYAIVSGGSLSAPGIAVLLYALLELVGASLELLTFVVIVQVLISWFSPDMPLAPVFNSLTRPFYGFFRRFIPLIGNVDLSPLFVLILARVLLIVLGTVLEGAPRALLTSG